MDTGGAQAQLIKVIRTRKIGYLRQLLRKRRFENLFLNVNRLNKEEDNICMYVLLYFSPTRTQCDYKDMQQLTSNNIKA